MKINHDEQNERFYHNIDEIEEPAELLYKMTPLSVDFYRTYVPEKARGGKLAYELVRTGIQWARENGLDIRASCWYVAKFLDAERDKKRQE